MRRQEAIAIVVVLLAAACGGSDGPASTLPARRTVEIGDRAVEPMEVFSSFRYAWAQQVTTAAGLQRELAVEGRFVGPDRHHVRGPWGRPHTWSLDPGTFRAQLETPGRPLRGRHSYAPWDLNPEPAD